MLVLTRKEKEGFVIAGMIRVVVTQIKGNVVRIGVEAPADIEIIRDDAKSTERKHDKPKAS